MVRATTLVAAFELARRVQMIDISSKKYFYSPDIVSEHYISKLRDSKQEEFWCLMLSSSKQMIRETQITIGTLNSSQVTPRESFKTAIQESAASVIFIHNHPSGNPEPSNEDIALTKQFVLAGNIIGIPVDDHIIIGGSQSVSLLERGVI
jgi:DNA repair protein RadC